MTDPEYDGNALAPFARGKALISDQLYGSLVSACNGSYWDAQEGMSGVFGSNPCMLRTVRS